MSAHTPRDAKGYWIVWIALLFITLVMLFLDRAPLPKLLFVLVMVGAMLTKASLIAAYFMHLRFERVALALMVVIGLLINGAIMYFLMIPDAYRILAMALSS